jgi:hypothetical protein
MLLPLFGRRLFMATSFLSRRKPSACIALRSTMKPASASECNLHGDLKSKRGKIEEKRVIDFRSALHSSFHSPARGTTKPRHDFGPKPQSGLKFGGLFVKHSRLNRFSIFMKISSKSTRWSFSTVGSLK